MKIIEYEEKYLEENAKIEIEIIRGPGVLVADNNRGYIHLQNGDKIFIEQSPEIARRIILKWR